MGDVTVNQIDRSRWPLEPGSGRGRSHGTSSSEPFDRWFRYPAGFASDYVGMLLDGLAVTQGAVVDCFAGSGVTGTASRLRGLDFIGLEAHPLIGELARLKLVPTAEAAQVRQLAKEVLDAVRIAAATSAREVTAETDLVIRSFPAETLDVLVRLRKLIKTKLDEPGGPYLKWALLATLRDVADVKVGWPYQRPGVARRPRHTDTLSRFEVRACLMADDLEELEGLGGSSPSAQLLIGDSQDPELWASFKGCAAACVASPPYLNNFDYADATRLELYFWGDVTSWADLRREVRSGMLTATTQQSSVSRKAVAVATLQATGTAAATEIVGLVEAIEHVQRDRGRRSKEYDQVVPDYFVAMSKILINLEGCLAPGATALWLVGDSAPYGVYVDTPRLIGELAGAAGLDYVEDVRLRLRGDRWGSASDRHRVPLAERLIVMHKPQAPAQSCACAEPTTPAHGGTSEAGPVG